MCRKTAPDAKLGDHAWKTEMMSVRVTELAEVGVTVLSRWIFNCYLVHDGGDGRALIVDPGLPSTTAAAIGLIEAAGGPPPVVVATHGHVDHVGGLPDLHAYGAAVCLPSRVRDYLGGEIPRGPGLREIAEVRSILREQPPDLGSVLEIARTGRHTGVGGGTARFPNGADHWLKDGDEVPGAPAWQVIQVPGHTDDSMALWNQGTGVLLSGDAVLSRQGRAWFTPEVCDPESAALTEERLRMLPVGYLLPGHGRVVVGAGLMGRALAPRERP